MLHADRLLQQGLLNPVPTAPHRFEFDDTPRQFFVRDLFAVAGNSNTRGCADTAGITGLRQNFEPGDLLILPAKMQFKSAPCTKPGYFSFAPFVGEGGEHIYITVVRLHEHFGDGGCNAEVTIYLQGPTAQRKHRSAALVLQVTLVNFIGPVAIAQPRPEGHLPGP